MLAMTLIAVHVNNLCTSKRSQQQNILLKTLLYIPRKSSIFASFEVLTVEAYIKVCHENWPLQVVNKLSLSTVMKNISSAVVFFPNRGEEAYCLENSIARERLKICRWLSHSPHIFEVFLGFSTIVGSWLFHIWSLFVKFSSRGFSAAIFVSEVQQSIESP